MGARVLQAFGLLAAAGAAIVGCSGGGGSSGNLAAVPTATGVPTALASIPPGTLKPGQNVALTLTIPARGGAASAARHIRVLPSCAGTLGIQVAQLAALGATPFPAPSAIATVNPLPLPQGTFIPIPTPGPSATSITVGITAPAGYDLFVVQAMDGSSSCTVPSPVPAPGNVLALGTALGVVNPNATSNIAVSMLAVIRRVTLTGSPLFPTTSATSIALTAQAYDADNTLITTPAINPVPLSVASPASITSQASIANQAVTLTLPSGLQSPLPIAASVTYPYIGDYVFTGTPTPAPATVYTAATSYVVLLMDGTTLYAINPNTLTATTVASGFAFQSLNTARCGSTVVASAVIPPSPTLGTVQIFSIAAPGATPVASTVGIAGLSGAAIDPATCTIWAIGGSSNWTRISSAGTIVQSAISSNDFYSYTPGPVAIQRNVVTLGTSAPGIPVTIRNGPGVSVLGAPSTAIPTPVPPYATTPAPFTSIDQNVFYADDYGTFYFGSSYGAAHLQPYTISGGTFGPVLTRVNGFATPIPYATPAYTAATRTGLGISFVGYGTTLAKLQNAGSSVSLSGTTTWPSTIKGVALSPDNLILWVNLGGGQIVAYPATPFMSGAPPPTAPSPAVTVTLPPGFAGTGGQMVTGG